MDKPFIDLTGHKGPLYLCDWDSGEFTEIHTPETLRAKYQDSGLFESGGNWSTDNYLVQVSGDFVDLLQYMDDEPDDRTMFRSHNMTIQRIR